MTIVERIGLLCKEQGISIRKLEILLGLGSSSINKWTKSSPSLSALQKIADHFHVSLDYLAGKTEYRESPPESKTVKNTDFIHKDIGLIEMLHTDERDMQKRLEGLLNYLEKNRGQIIFSGEQMDKRTEEMFILSLENLIDNTKRKFIPQSYTKPEEAAT